MIYLPEDKIQEFGGVEKMATKEEFEKLKTKLLSKDLKLTETTVKVNGSMSYVE